LPRKPRKPKFEFYWDEKVKRYRRPDGHFVSENEITEVVNKRIEDGFKSLSDQVDALLAGDVNIEDWQTAFARELSRAHVQLAAFGKGGWKRMSQSDWGNVGNNLKFEFERLNTFASQIVNKELSAKQIKARINLYNRAANKAYWREKTKVMADTYKEERRVLGSAEHCEDCVDYASKGWQPIGSLPEPGEESVCFGNCKCTKEYR
jgi:hypothetical protein